MTDAPLAPPERAHRLVPLLIVALALLARFAILRLTHSTTEDFYITLRYADNIASGRGFAYNPGQPVLGTTTPLYTLLLALAELLRFDPVAVGKGLNILAEGLTCLLIVRLLTALGRRETGWLAALLYATASAPISVSIGGMETGLVTLAGMGVVTAFVERRALPMAAALGLLFLLRIDGIALAVVLAVGWGLGWNRTPDGETSGRRARFLPVILLFALIALPWVVYATWAFGSPIPTSAAAKVLVYGRTRPGFLPNLPDFRHQFLGGQVQVAIFVLFLLGLGAGVTRYRALRAPAAWLLLYYSAMLLSRVPCFPWYFVPPLPLYYAFVALGVVAGADLLMNSAGFGFRIAEGVSPSAMAGWALFFVSLPLVWHLRAVRADVAAAQRLEDEVRRPLGEWLGRAAAPTDRVLLEPIGYIGYFSRLPVIDVIGLVSPEVLPSYRPEVPNPVKDIVTRFRPEWMVLRRDERDGLAPDPPAAGNRLLDGAYALARSFPESPKSGEPALFVYRRVAR